MLKKHFLFILVCIGAVITEFVVIAQNMSPWWDSAIYTGMGKFFFTGGAIGLWETLRPPLLPIMIGAGWFVGLNPLHFAQFLLIAFTLGILILLYVLGEKIEKGVGLVSALILALTPTFTFFVSIPTSDIPSTFFSLLGAYFIIRKRYFWAGFSVALAFLIRFPHGLFLVPFGLVILIQNWNTKDLKQWLITSAKNVCLLALGFAILAIPYLIINTIIYHDAFLPLKLGRDILEGDKNQIDFFYYFKQLIIDNPLLVLWIIGFFMAIVHACQYFFQKNNTSNKKLSFTIILSVLSVLIVGSYLSNIGHKELRYSFAFLPYIILLAGYGLSTIWNISNHSKRHYSAIIAIAIIGSVSFWTHYTASRNSITPLTQARSDYYSFLPDQVGAITTSPQIMLQSNANIVGVFDAWERGSELLSTNNGTFSYIAMDSCQQITCWADSCDAPKQAFEQALATSTAKVFDAVDGQCKLTIYKVN